MQSKGHEAGAGGHHMTTTNDSSLAVSAVGYKDFIFSFSLAVLPPPVLHLGFPFWITEYLSVSL